MFNWTSAEVNRSEMTECFGREKKRATCVATVLVLLDVMLFKCDERSRGLLPEHLQPRLPGWGGAPAVCPTFKVARKTRAASPSLLDSSLN